MQQFQGTSTSPGAHSGKLARKAPRPPLSPAAREAILAGVRAGLEYKDICARFGVTKQDISRLAVRAGLKRTSKARALTDEQEADIIGRYQAGASSASLAAEFNVSNSLIWNVFYRRGIPMRPTGAVPAPLRHDAFDVLTPEAAYWCGFIFTDGTISERATGQPEIAIVLQRRDRAHLEKFRCFLGSGHAITPIAPAKVSPQVAAPNGGQGTGAFRFSVRSRRIADRLYGLGRYGPAVHPELAASRDFWRGCVDGDGTIGIYSGVPGIKLLGSQWLMQAYVDFLGPISSRRPLRARPARSLFVVSAGYGTAVKVAERLYTGAGTALDRKAGSAAAVIRNGPGKTPLRKAR